MADWSLLPWVALGGAAGSVGRFLVTSGARQMFGPAFPWGTAAVNLAGSFAMGFAVVWVVRHLDDGPAIRAFLLVGVLGGFTTFSAFSLDAVALAERGAVWLGVLYSAGSVVGGIAALLAGLALARAVLPEVAP